jgi:hypothetical protein
LALRRAMTTDSALHSAGFSRRKPELRLGASGKSEILVTHLILRTILEQERLLIINYQLFHWIPHLSRSLLDRLLTLYI